MVVYFPMDVVAACNCMWQDAQLVVGETSIDPEAGTGASRAHVHLFSLSPFASSLPFFVSPHFVSFSLPFQIDVAGKHQ